EVKTRGKLVMLSFPDMESPFIRVDVDRGLGHFTGIDYDVLSGFAHSLGVPLEVRAVKPAFAELVPALLRGEGDVVASSFSITPERRAKVDFSEPYFGVRMVVVVPRDSPIRSVADLGGRTGSAVRGSSLEGAIKNLGEVKLHYVDFMRWNYDALMAKEADFTVLEEPFVWSLLGSYPDLKVAFALPGKDAYGFAVAPKSDLQAALDAYLAQIKGNGQLDGIVRKYLGDKAGSGVTGTK
ncbi:MAG TPA: transporter substrate-binding domain-containing protein, partial [Thermoanaerobaculia bacterium]|nr:transporter substrate-binding domain-containing protein [Thermoanaerobaculia bacterium]